MFNCKLWIYFLPKPRFLLLLSPLRRTGLPLTFKLLLSYSRFFFFFNFILFLNFTVLYWFCQISKWIRHRYTCIPHPEPSSLLPPHTIPLHGNQWVLAWTNKLGCELTLYFFKVTSKKQHHNIGVIPKFPKLVGIIAKERRYTFSGSFIPKETNSFSSQWKLLN